jgi:hypothetical protein
VVFTDAPGDTSGADCIVLRGRKPPWRTSGGSGSAASPRFSGMPPTRAFPSGHLWRLQMLGERIDDPGGVEEAGSESMGGRPASGAHLLRGDQDRRPRPGGGERLGPGTMGSPRDRESRLEIHMGRTVPVSATSFSESTPLLPSSPGEAARSWRRTGRRGPMARSSAATSTVWRTIRSSGGLSSTGCGGAKARPSRRHRETAPSGRELRDRSYDAWADFVATLWI